MIRAIRGVIDRRILVTFRVDPDALATLLPDPFRPRTVDGHGVGGVCFIRLRDVRPRGLPAVVGVGSENAAHRIAVEWTDEGERRTGVYVPRRHTNSTLNTLLGGRLFPGIHRAASFDVDESDDRLAVTMRSDDGDAHASVVGEPTDSLPDGSVFETVSAASSFFEDASLGHSPSAGSDGFEAIELHAVDWEVTPLTVESVASGYFAEHLEDQFTIDHALLLEDIDHEWHEGEPVCSAPASG